MAGRKVAPIKLALHSFPLRAAIATLRLLSEDCLSLHDRRLCTAPRRAAGSGCARIAKRRIRRWKNVTHSM